MNSLSGGTRRRIALRNGELIPLPAEGQEEEEARRRGGGTISMLSASCNKEEEELICGSNKCKKSR